MSEVLSNLMFQFDTFIESLLNRFEKSLVFHHFTHTQRTQRRKRLHLQETTFFQKTCLTSKGFSLHIRGVQVIGKLMCQIMLIYLHEYGNYIVENFEVSNYLKVGKLLLLY